MEKSLYIEDLVILSFDSQVFIDPSVGEKDRISLCDFYDACIMEKSFTAKQAKYLVALLKKHQGLLKGNGIDCVNELDNPIFKKPFRQLDHTMRISIDCDEFGNPMILFKFPYSFKETFDREFDQKLGYRSRWDPDKSVRILDFYAVNIIQVHEFAVANRFEIDDSFLNAAHYVEEVWNSQTQIEPSCEYKDGVVSLVAAAKDALDFFDRNKTGNWMKDLFLAKSMGYHSTTTSASSLLEKLCTNPDNQFWIKDLDAFFDLYLSVGKKAAIIMCRVSEKKNWIDNFVRTAENHKIERDKIRVCFREKEATSDFNQWIKQNHLGGKVDTADIFLFEHKPPKWAFAIKDEINILATNMINPSTNLITNDWLNSHPCSIYLTDIKPTSRGGKNIVEL